MKRLLTSLALILSLSACEVTPTDSTSTTLGEITPNSRSTVTAPVGTQTHVVRVVDGDTLVVTGNVKVRAIGADTPETVDPSKPVECYGPEASAFTKQLLPPGTEVTLVYDQERKDRYSRDLAYVYRTSDGLFVNAEVLEEGYARVLSIAPNTLHRTEFAGLERDAKVDHRGLWGAC